MPAVTADATSQLLQADPGAQFLIVNNDTAEPVYISQERPVTALDTQIPAQGSASLTGWWYVSTLDRNTTVECFVLPGGLTWSNPVGVQIALSALGLAKDTTVQATNSQLATGVAPFATNIQSFSLLQVNQTGSPYTVHTFGAAGRLWAAHLSFALSANNSHTGNDQAFATLGINSKVLIPIELAVGGSNSTDSGDGDLSMPGYPVANGDELILNVNGGAAISQALMRASCVGLVSFP